MSIHVVDVSRGIVAVGMRVEVFALGVGDRCLVARGVISAKGTLDEATLEAMLTAGSYEAVFWVRDYYRDAKVVLPSVP
jgi:5-hydroxyisourate hydrolase